MSKEKELKCESCGVLSTIAEAVGAKLEIQQDGRILCPVCKEILPQITKKISEDLHKRAVDFSAFIDASACMFNLDELSVTAAAADIMLNGLDLIIKHDRVKAVLLITDVSKSFEEKLTKIKKEDDEESKKKEEVK